MVNNLILVLVTLIILYFIGMLWLRQQLLQKLREIQRHKEILQKDHEHRRDQVPLLLESVRAVQEPSDAWRKLLQDRATISVATEIDFENSLQDFMAQTPLRSLDFLEVKKSIEEDSALIQKERDAIQSAVTAFNAERKIFPYNWAAALFGFHELA